jgi:tRNA pseudouridine55 synthase
VIRLPEGLLLVDKPEGPTSHDVVDRVRRMTGQRRIGHSGTLDPMASGLLPLVLGRATRLVRFLPHSPKIYEGRIRLGITTDTDDVTGAVLSRHAGSLPSTAAVRDAASRLVGRVSQVPPAVSARRVGGKRLYRLARSGRKAEARAADVEVFRLDVAPGEDAEDWSLYAEVSAGTYVRAIARDLGAALGCGAALAALRRVAIGPMSLSNALKIGHEAQEAAFAAAVIPLEEMPLDPPGATLPDAVACARFCAGLPVPLPEGAPSSGMIRAFSPALSLLGVGEARGGLIHPRVVIAPPVSQGD